MIMLHINLICSGSLINRTAVESCGFQKKAGFTGQNLNPLGGER